MNRKDDNDKMGYQRAAKDLGVKGDLKLKAAAMGVWWLTGVIFAMLVLKIFFKHSYPVDLLIAVPVGLVFMLLFYYVVLPRFIDKERDFFKATIRRFNREGNSRELAALLDEHLRTMIPTQTNAGYYNTYLNILTTYNLNMMNFTECMRLLDLKNMEHLHSFYNYPSGKQSMVMHHYLRIMTISQMGEPHKLEYYYGDASRVFYECRGMNRLVDAMIAESDAMRELAHASEAKYSGDTARAEQSLDNAELIMQPWANVESLRQDYCTLIARSALMRGNREAARKLFDEAYSLAKNDFQRESVKREKQFFMGEE